ncbi:MAG: EAL domain-containing protein [Nitrospirota bacterium]|nr:EAL domain-containing protein [Nitrospirota bacterium]
MYPPPDAETKNRPLQSFQPGRFLLAAAGLIFLIELLLMFLLAAFPPLPFFWAGIIHASFLAAVLSPFLYMLVLRPWAHLLSDLKRSDENVRLAYNVLESSSEPVLITDAHANIEYVNPAFCSITGYSREEVIGKNPKIMKSDRHDEEFYKEMWTSLAETGQWQGEIWDRRKSGEVYPKWLSVSAVKDDSGKVVKYVSIFSDITSLKQTEEYLERLTHYDRLTGLPNRILLRDRLKQELMQAGRKKQILAVMFLDIDRFKNINDTFGNLAGDQLLKEFSERLADCAGGEETVAHLGGDEFAIIVSNMDSAQSAAIAAQKILTVLSNPFLIRHHEVFVTISIGITVYPADGETADSLMRNANMALQKAREQGNNSFQFYDRSMSDRAFEYLSMETNLRYALERNEFVLHYQPQVDLATGRIIGMEALIRRQEQGWLVPPSKFIPLAEETGLIIPICEWTLLTACRQAKLWQSEGLPPLRLAVNVTASQFYQKKLLQTVKNVLDETGLAPEHLELELTEKIIMRDAKSAIGMMRELKEMGVCMSIDDFGTGYSSLNYLKQFPVDKLKIDISFVKDLPHDPGSASISKAIIMLAHSLNLKAIAEGVETEKQLAFMLEHGCDELQGFYFSTPLPVDAFKEFVLSGKRLAV